jgi:hypothetical protein
MKAGEQTLKAWEVAERLGVTPRWVLERFNRTVDSLPGHRLGGHGPLYFYWSELEPWLKRNPPRRRPNVRLRAVADAAEQWRCARRNLDLKIREAVGAGESVADVARVAGLASLAVRAVSEEEGVVTG